MIETIYCQQKKLLGHVMRHQGGHVMRHQGLLRDVINGTVVGKKGRGRKRKTLFDYWRMKENGRTETYGEIKRRAECRDGWHVWH